MALAAPGDRANGQPAIGAYTWDEAEGAYLPFALDVLTLEGKQIKQVTSFITRVVAGEDREYYKRWPDHPNDPAQVASVFESFGLPARVDLTPSGSSRTLPRSPTARCPPGP